MNVKNDESIKELLKRHIDNLSYDMRDDMFDGWTKDYYRNILEELRDYINKELEKNK